MDKLRSVFRPQRKVLCEHVIVDLEKFIPKSVLRSKGLETVYDLFFRVQKNRPTINTPVDGNCQE